MLTRLQLIGVTRGLNHLHNNEVILGDLGGVSGVHSAIFLTKICSQSNVLIDTEGNPRLHNFTHCLFTKNTDPANILAPSYGYTFRYCAPERFGVEGPMKEPTMMSDVYALSMVIVEVCLFSNSNSS